MDFKEKIIGYYETLKRVIDNLNYDELNEAMNVIYQAYLDEKNVYTCGNGGSASTASHMQNDFNKGICYDLEKKFHFHCLNDNYSTIMAIANDDSYEMVFAKQLEGNIKEGDILIAISGSGNSKNIVKACEVAKANGAIIIGLSGFKGGKLFEMSDYHMHCAIEDMQITEDIHMTFNHMMMSIFCKMLNDKACGCCVKTNDECLTSVDEESVLEIETIENEEVQSQVEEEQIEEEKDEEDFLQAEFDLMERFKNADRQTRAQITQLLVDIADDKE